MAQLVARLNGIQKVTSSNLVSSTTERQGMALLFFVVELISRLKSRILTKFARRAYSEWHKSFAKLLARKLSRRSRRKSR